MTLSQQLHVLITSTPNLFMNRPPFWKIQMGIIKEMDILLLMIKAVSSIMAIQESKWRTRSKTFSLATRAIHPRSRKSLKWTFIKGTKSLMLLLLRKPCRKFRDCNLHSKLLALNRSLKILKFSKCRNSVNSRHLLHKLNPNKLNPIIQVRTLRRFT